MKNKLAAVGFIAMSVFWFTSCNSDETTNISLEIKAVSEYNNINSGGRVEVSDLTFTSILIGVTELEFESETEDENEVDGVEFEEELEYEGEFVIDLISGTSTPEFGLADVNPGDYNEFEIELAPLIEDLHSVKIEGTYIPSGGSNPVQFVYTNDQEFEIEIEKEGGNFNLPEGAISNILVLLDLDAVFASVSLDNAVADNDGIVRIRRGNENEALAIAIENAFVQSFDCGEDNNNDDKFDD